MKKLNEMETGAPMCVPEILKLCIAKIMLEGWLVKLLDVKAAYLQVKEIGWYI